MNFFEEFLNKVGKVPTFRVDREEFLRNKFSRKVRNPKLLEAIIDKGPIEAGVPLGQVSKIADALIKSERWSTTGISTLAGLPGGLVMLATIPADLAQFYGAIFRAIQKLMYLYGWESSVFDEDGELDDETRNVLIIFIGAMFGVKTASQVLANIAGKSAANAAKGLLLKSMKKMGVVASAKLIHKLIKTIGLKSSMKLVTGGAKKVIPIVGGVVSGAVTYVAFGQMMTKLKDYLETGVIDIPDEEDETEDIITDAE